MQNDARTVVGFMHFHMILATYDFVGRFRYLRRYAKGTTGEFLGGIPASASRERYGASNNLV